MVDPKVLSGFLRFIAPPSYNF